MKRFLSAALAFALAAEPALAAGGQRSVPLPKTGGLSLGSVQLPSISLSQVPALPSMPAMYANSVQTQLPYNPAAHAVAPSAQPLAPQAHPIAPVPVAQRIVELAQSVQADAAVLPNLGGEASKGVVDSQIAKLTGVGETPSSGALPVSTPQVPSSSSTGPVSFLKKAFRRDGGGPPKKPELPGVKKMMLAVPVFKIGNEAVALGFPLVALMSGGALSVAGMVVAYQFAQALSGSFTGLLTDRFPAAKIVSGALVAQAVLVAAVIALSAAGVFSHGMLFPVYAVIGATLGIVDTARRSIPALLIGQDEAALRDYNARMHRRYQVAGVLGAFAIAGLLSWVGPLWTLALQPPTFLLAAWMFWKVEHPRPAPSEFKASGGVVAGIKRWGSDLRRGASLVVGDKRVRWLALAMIAPQIVHRVFEDLFMPVYAKAVLGSAAMAAILLAASNLGEFGGASALLRWSKKHPGAAPWVKWGGWGMLAGWTLSLGAGLPLIWSMVLLLPAIFLFSATWAGSHLSLETDLQDRVAVQDQPRVIAFLNALYIAGSAAVSFSLGRLLDSVGVKAGFLTIEIGLTILAVVILYAASRLKKTDRK